MSKPLMPKATAVWLVDNTTLSFKQIADFCGLHELEVQGIADGDVAGGVKGFDPVANNQLDAIEIERGEKDPRYVLKLKYNPAAEGEEKRRGPRYTPLSKRQDRPAWPPITAMPKASSTCLMMMTRMKTTILIRARAKGRR